MSNNSNSLLRQRMIEDMTARRFKEKVQKDYVQHVRTFTEFLGRSPDTAASEDLRRFQLHMAQQQIGAPTINAASERVRGYWVAKMGWCGAGARFEKEWRACEDIGFLVRGAAGVEEKRPCEGESAIMIMRCRW